MSDGYLELGLHQFPSLYAGVKLFLPLKAATVNYPHSWRTILFAGNNTQSCQTLKRFSVPSSPLLTDQPPHTAVLPLSLSTGQMSWANCVFQSFFPNPVFFFLEMSLLLLLKIINKVLFFSPYMDCLNGEI